MVMRRVVSGFCLLAGITLAGYAKLSWYRAHVPTPDSIARLHRRLPPLPAVDATGKAVDLRELALGCKSVIVFYSASCRLCQSVLPELKPFPPALRLLLVNEESDRLPGTPHIPLLEGALHQHAPNRVRMRSLPMSGIPTILFVDERGILRDGLIGEHARGRLRNKLVEFAGARQ